MRETLLISSFFVGGGGGGGGGGIAFSISMYIMCVCLFSALSRRVGALQMPIIIIIITGPNLFQFTRLCSV